MTKIFNININPRTIAAPIVAFTMAGLLFVYSRTSIKAAKRNAQRHRTADGGQISWRNENLRRHGVLKRPSDDHSMEELVRRAKDQASDALENGRGGLEGDDILQAKRRKPRGSR